MTWDSLFFMELQRLGGKTPVISSNSWQRYAGSWRVQHALAMKNIFTAKESTLADDFQ
jgi:hypothetical protein